MAVKNLTKHTKAALLDSAARTPKIVEVVLDAVAVPLAENDVAVLFYVPPRHRVANVKIEVLRVEGAAATVDVGPFSDAGVTAVDADGLLAAADINALTHANSVTGAADLGQKGYATGASAGYICLTALAATGIEAAKIKAQAEIIPYD